MTEQFNNLKSLAHIIFISKIYNIYIYFKNIQGKYIYKFRRVIIFFKQIYKFRVKIMNDIYIEKTEFIIMKKQMRIILMSFDFMVDKIYLRIFHCPKFVKENF